MFLSSLYIIINNRLLYIEQPSDFSKVHLFFQFDGELLLIQLLIFEPIRLHNVNKIKVCRVLIQNKTD